jgi:DNA-binding NarL/FixJ family response regulator/class 3 adenylate cyclase
VSAQTIVVLFTDLVSSTKLLTSLGPDGPETIALHHLADLEELTRANGGVVVKNTGDGIMATYPSAAAALDGAVAIQRRLDGAVAADPVGGRIVRIGISAGDATPVESDWFGGCVVEASRLCAAAHGGQVLVSETLVRLAGTGSRHEFRSAGRLDLAGLPQPTEAYEVAWEAAEERPLSVVIADDNALLRSGIAGLLTNQGFRVAGEAGDANELLALVDSRQPDLVVVDIRMPPTFTLEGIRAAAQIKEKYPQIGVLILSQYLESREALGLLADHTERFGYLLKDRVADVHEFVSALKTIAGGGTAIDREVVARLLGRRRLNDPIESLTPRELEVLSLMAEGLSNQAISDRLTLGLRTVEAHIAAIFAKLGLEPEAEGHRRVLAVVAFLRRP